MSQGDASSVLRLDGADKELQLERPVTLPELRRHKRAFLKLATQNNWTRLQDVHEARNMFIQYLQNNLSV